VFFLQMQGTSHSIRQGRQIHLLKLQAWQAWAQRLDVVYCDFDLLSFVIFDYFLYLVGWNYDYSPLISIGVAA
jgi:hypothetical protein